MLMKKKELQLKKEGDTVSQDEVIAEIETDKVVLEVLAQSDGVISKIIKSEGETVISSEVIGEYEEGSSDISKKEDITKEVDLPKETEKKNIKNKKNGPAVKKILSEKNIDPTPQDERQNNIRKFQTDPECRFLIGTPQTGGYGITLTQANTVIYYSNGYDLEKRLQSEDRAHRIGQKKAVTYVDLITEKTVDEKIVKALRKKINIASEVLGEELKDWI